MTSVSVSKDCIKRLLSDIKEITLNPLNDHGIYYKHDESNMLKGYIMIVPGEGSPYSYGYFMLTLDFPNNYPYSPPKATYITNNGTTRFHPNYYMNGKVCLSLLNTWRGEEWSSCNTITSILLHMASILTPKALVNEPGVNESHYCVATYDKCIAFQTLKTAILDVYTKRTEPEYYLGLPVMFRDVIEETFAKNKTAIMETLEERKDNMVERLKTFYGGLENIDYGRLYQDYLKYLDN